MSHTIRKATPQDYPHLISFANEVFEEDFAAFLPKLYNNNPKAATEHIIITSNDNQNTTNVNIDGLLCIHSGVLHVGEDQLHLRSIGTVAVHSRCRGKGYMQQLMHEATRLSMEDGADMLCLGGQRQRYENFGYAKSCTKYSYTITPASCRHFAASISHITLLPLHENKRYIDDCMGLHSSQSYHIARDPNAFTDILSSWHHTPYVILENGTFSGYASISNKKTSIQELILANYNTSAAVISAISALCAQTINLTAYIHQPQLITILNNFAEYANIEQVQMINILNFPSVISAFLRHKQAQSGILNGTCVINITNANRYKITVTEKSVKVVKTTSPPDISLTHVEITSQLFSPTALHHHHPILQSWFPLLFTLPPADMI